MDDEKQQLSAQTRKRKYEKPELVLLGDTKSVEGGKRYSNFETFGAGYAAQIGPS